MTARVSTRRAMLGRLGAIAAMGIAGTLGAGLAGCAHLPGGEPLRVNLVGIEPLPGEGLEVRFALKLRVQNPNELPVEFDGIWLDLDLNGRALASGVSADKGTVPRFGDAVVTVPVSVSAIGVLRQALALAEGGAKPELPYRLRGRLGGNLLGSGVLGGNSFSSEGLLKLPP